MEDFRSKSCGDGRNMQMEPYYGSGGGGGGGGGMNDLRCQSATYNNTSVGVPAPQNGGVKDIKLKKGKNGGSSSTKSWSFNDPELQRKKRVASYKVYTVEGKMKGSFRKSFRWLKDRLSAITRL
ncbi:hypothetical protein MKW94_001214 [Papaver nudicaule]|uniref:DUF3511 domain protein n=1 Tax=Papaver nudicaule TaxID=74823 RepID=A0AA41S0N1_PAPNU|nr:hypothetical protein [Papaver nudicaule]